MILELSSDERAFQQSVDAFAREHVAPRAAEVDETNLFPRDLVAACEPISAKVTGEFNTRGGMRSVIEAEYRRD